MKKYHNDLQHTREQFFKDLDTLNDNQLLKKYGAIKWFLNNGTLVPCPPANNFQADDTYNNIGYRYLGKEDNMIILGFNMSSIPIGERVIPEENSTIVFRNKNYTIKYTIFKGNSRPATGLVYVQ